MAGRNTQRVAKAAFGISATGPYIKPKIGMLKTMCNQRTSFRSVDAFIVLLCGESTKYLHVCLSQLGVAAMNGGELRICRDKM
jgi:hypothetical protein